MTREKPVVWLPGALTCPLRVGCRRVKAEWGPQQPGFPPGVVVLPGPAAGAAAAAGDTRESAHRLWPSRLLTVLTAVRKRLKQHELRSSDDFIGLFRFACWRMFQSRDSQENSPPVRSPRDALGRDRWLCPAPCPRALAGGPQRLAGRCCSSAYE